MPVLLELLPSRPSPFRLTGQHETDKAALTTSLLDDRNVCEALYRLVRCSNHERDAQVLGPALKREMLYRALCGGQASMLFELAHRSGKYARLSSVIDTIHHPYQKKLN